MKEAQLLFVYNADSDLFSSVTDFAHKILSPSTYDCQLCKLTFGNFSEKREWKSFIQQFPLKTIFLHKDEFEKAYKMEAAYPIIFMLENGALKELITRPEIARCKTTDGLKNLINKKYSDYVQHNYPHI